jgi:hypothetical protein
LPRATFTQVPSNLAHIFTGITEHQTLPESYVAENQQAINKQVVVGGLRLAYVIKTIFGNSAKSTMNQLFLQ